MQLDRTREHARHAKASPHLIAMLSNPTAECDVAVIAVSRSNFASNADYHKLEFST
jgi:hypothetical protein